MGAIPEKHRLSPPLESLPSWAQARTPTLGELRALRRETWSITERLRDLGRVLARVPGPSPAELRRIETEALAEALAAVVDDVRALPYTVELTAWVNDARVLAARSATHFDICLGDLQRLYHLSAITPSYRECLANVRRHVTNILRDLDLLIGQLDDYLYSDVPVISSDDTAWQQGRRAGLHEGLEVIREVLRQPLDASETTALDGAISTLRERLGAATAGGPSLPQRAVGTED